MQEGAGRANILNALSGQAIEVHCVFGGPGLLEAVYDFNAEAQRNARGRREG